LGQDALGCLHRAGVEPNGSWTSTTRRLDDSTIRRLDDLGADRGVMDIVDADDYLIGEAPLRSPS
jgi:hypothetical protein